MTSRQSVRARRDRFTQLATYLAAQPLHRYRAWEVRRRTRSLAGATLLREFARAHPRAFFIQIGSNDGQQHDPLRATILRQQWRGIMIEPVPYVFERLVANYASYADRVALENVAIADRDGYLPFYHLAPVDDYAAQGLPQWYDGIGSFHRDHVMKHVSFIPDIADRLVQTEVPTMTFETLCRKHNVDDLQLLHIDAEGSDFELLKSIDLRRHRPRLIVYEHYHLSESDQAHCRKHMEALDYDTFEHGMDTWCLSQDAPAVQEQRLLDLWQAVKPEGPEGRGSLRRIVAGRPLLRRVARRGWHTLKRRVEGNGRAEIEYWIDFMMRYTTAAEWRMLTQPFDETTPLPPGAEIELSDENPALRTLRDEYTRAASPITARSIWSEGLVESQLDLRYFRGENPYVWHYREWPRAMILKYFVLTEYISRRDSGDLLRRLGEDGAFGCWTFEYPGYPRVSRDLLDSVNEILFLERHLGILDRPRLRVLDIGAGYGRTAYRLIQAATDVADYCCVDAIPESTFICDYYLRYRGCTPPARVVPLHELDRATSPGHFDLAVNIHSFSECTFDAISWWLRWVEQLQIPNLLIVPNDRDELLSSENDGTRREFRTLVEASGYELSVCEPVLEDPAVRELVRVHDYFFLFQRRV